MVKSFERCFVITEETGGMYGGIWGRICLVKPEELYSTASMPSEDMAAFWVYDETDESKLMLSAWHTVFRISDVCNEIIRVTSGEDWTLVRLHPC